MSEATELQKKAYRIFINGAERTIDSDVVSYEEVVHLLSPTPAPNTFYTVLYEKAKESHEGELMTGETVLIKQGTEFDVDIHW